MRGRGTSTSLVIIRIEIKKKIYDKPCDIVYSNFLREGGNPLRGSVIYSNGRLHLVNYCKQYNTACQFFYFIFYV